MTESDCPEVALCSWQDVKIQLLTNKLIPSLILWMLWVSMSHSVSNYTQGQANDKWHYANITDLSWLVNFASRQTAHFPRLRKKVTWEETKSNRQKKESSWPVWASHILQVLSAAPVSTFVVFPDTGQGHSRQTLNFSNNIPVAKNKIVKNLFKKVKVWQHWFLLKVKRRRGLWQQHWQWQCQ